ncbi:MAG: glucokinase [Magnetospiraceae bacterium]
MPSSLIADIGGTNARFALVAETGDIGPVTAFKCADYPSLTAAAQRFLAVAAPAQPPTHGAFCVASPISGDRVTLTNHAWAFSIAETGHALGLNPFTVINDFNAIARAIPHLGDADREKIGGGTRDPKRPIGILGAGTGLGVSSLVPTPEGHWLPFSGEGGHVTLAATTDREAEILAHLRGEFGHVSAERALSGQGLENLYGALAALSTSAPKYQTAAEITAAAGEDSLATETVALFCGFLGNVAGNLALSLGAKGGIYIAGGIVPRLGSAFAASPFRQQFEAKGRFSDYLKPIPTYVVTHPYPALVGLAHLLDD